MKSFNEKLKEAARELLFKSKWDDREVNYVETFEGSAYENGAIDGANWVVEELAKADGFVEVYTNFINYKTGSWTKDKTAFHNPNKLIQIESLTASQAREKMLQDQYNELLLKEIEQAQINVDKRCKIGALETKIAELQEKLNDAMVEGNNAINDCNAKTLQVAELQAEATQRELFAEKQMYDILHFKKEFEDEQNRKFAFAKTNDELTKKIAGLQSEKNEIGLIAGLKDAQIAELQAEFKLNANEHIRIVGLYNELESKNAQLMKALERANFKLKEIAREEGRQGCECPDEENPTMCSGCRIRYAIALEPSEAIRKERS